MLEKVRRATATILALHVLDVLLRWIFLVHGLLVVFGEYFVLHIFCAEKLTEFADGMFAYMARYHSIIARRT